MRSASIIKIAHIRQEFSHEDARVMFCDDSVARGSRLGGSDAKDRLKRLKSVLKVKDLSEVEGSVRQRLTVDVENAAMNQVRKLVINGVQKFMETLQEACVVKDELNTSRLLETENGLKTRVDRETGQVIVRKKIGYRAFPSITQ